MVEATEILLFEIINEFLVILICLISESGNVIYSVIIRTKGTFIVIKWILKEVESKIHRLRNLSSITDLNLYFFCLHPHTFLSVGLF